MTEAEAAAAGWGGTVGRLIGARENLIYEMAMAGGGRAALRLHRLAYQSEAAIRAELDWCTQLYAAGLPVACPVPDLRGDLLRRLPSGRLVSATGWIDGVPLGATHLPLQGPVDALIRHHLRLGRLLARLHAVTDADPPRGFARPRWDVDGLTGEAPFWGRFWEHPAATSDQTRVLSLARAQLRRRLEAMRTAGADAGPIHADVLRENVLVNGDALWLIDFDDCGTGFRAHDLGTALLANWQEPSGPRLRAALIGGYGELRPVDGETVDLFTLARACASVGWTMARLAPDDPVHGNHIARAVRFAEALL